MVRDDPEQASQRSSLLAQAKQVAAAALRGGTDESAHRGVVSPARRGAALVFFTINDLGPPEAPWSKWQREALAWHGHVGLVPGGEGKWIMQKFKELPMQLRPGGEVP
eukprot:TRINITY_DN17469_c0_g1_i3.p2 TRINITY_DN17469_c0_g1~~TRINITY_DN17469_c0_g1_i3.p2  ORF type:complete len:108 (+),score=32.95 TRINITY_DN17469_c0_g1_i3:302-625(+)